MNKIEKFMLPEHTNKLYTEEAISSVSLTRDVADKINELVDAYNVLSRTDLTWKQEQEGTIRKAIIYIKDNLLNTLHELCEIYKNEGYFKQYVESYTSTLEKQLENLLNSSTVDGELIDVRYGADGKIYNTAGEAVRSQISDVFSKIIEMVNTVETANKLKDYSANYNLEENGNITPYEGRAVLSRIHCEHGKTYYLLSGNNEYNVSTIRQFVRVLGFDKYDNIVDNYANVMEYKPSSTVVSFIASCGLTALTNDRYVGVFTSNNVTFAQYGRYNAGKFQDHKCVYAHNYGLVADGTTDNWNAFKEMLSNIGSNTTIVFDSGIYVIEKANEYLTLPDTVEMVSNGTTTILCKDSEEKGLSFFTGANKELRLRGIRFESNLFEIPSNKNAVSLFYNPNGVKKVRIEDCEFYGWRSFLFIAVGCDDVVITNNTYKYIARDCNRFINARKTFVHGNAFYHCGDDVIAFHNTDTTHVQEHIFTNNILELSYGCGYLGCSNVIVSNNIFKYPLYLLKCGVSGTEGQRSENIVFKNNSVDSPLHFLNISLGRTITHFENCKNIIFEGNNFTLSKESESFTNLLTNSLNSTGTYLIANVPNDNVSVTIGKTLIDAKTNVSNVKILHNLFESAVGLSSLGEGDTNYISGDIAKVDIIGNIFKDFTKSISNSTNLISWNVVDNVFNGDNKNRMGHNGVFPSVNNLDVFLNTVGYFKGNILQNVSTNRRSNGGNYVKTDYRTGVNIGVTHIIENGDTIILWDINDQLIQPSISYSVSIPNTGYFYKGEFVKNSNFENPLLYGWKRLTTGNNHELNVDWKELKFNE